MSVRIMAKVWANSQRKDGELLVMLALADFSNDAGESWPSIPVLAQKARLTERQTRRVLIKLQQVGEIRKAPSNGGRNRRNHYFITLTENPDKITGKELQSKNNSVIGDQKTLTPMSGALNRHRTVNKNTEPNGSNSNPSHSKKVKHPTLDPAVLAAFNRFYKAYPRHVGRQEAERAWIKLNPDSELVTVIMAAVERYANEVGDTEPRFIKHPATWLNGRRWEDETVNGRGNGHIKPPQVKTLDNGMIEVGGVQMDRRIYEKRYGHRNT